MRTVWIIWDEDMCEVAAWDEDPVKGDVPAEYASWSQAFDYQVREYNAGSANVPFCRPLEVTVAGDRWIIQGVSYTLNELRHQAGRTDRPLEL